MLNQLTPSISKVATTDFWKQIMHHASEQVLRWMCFWKQKVGRSLKSALYAESKNRACASVCFGRRRRKLNFLWKATYRTPVPNNTVWIFLPFHSVLLFFILTGKDCLECLTQNSKDCRCNIIINCLGNLQDRRTYVASETQSKLLLVVMRNRLTLSLSKGGKR